MEKYKKAKEAYILQSFLSEFNTTFSESFSIFEEREAPDFAIKNKLGHLAGIELTELHENKNLRTGEQSSWEGKFCNELIKICNTLLGADSKRCRIIGLPIRPILPPKDNLKKVSDEFGRLLKEEKSQLLLTKSVKFNPPKNICNILKISEICLSSFTNGPRLTGHFSDIGHNKVSDHNFKNLLLDTISGKGTLAEKYKWSNELWLLIRSTFDSFGFDYSKRCKEIEKDIVDSRFSQIWLINLPLNTKDASPPIFRIK